METKKTLHEIAFVGIFESGTLVPQGAEILDEIMKSYGKGHEAVVYYSMMIQTIHCFYWTPSRLFRLGLLSTSNCW